MNRASWIAASQLLLAVLIVVGVWVALPARWLWVDVPLTLLALGAAAAGGALLARKPWALRVLRVVLWIELAAGALVVSLLALSIAQLAGNYGPVGSGGAVLMGTIAALILPYLVGLPALLLAAAKKLRA
jgi:hypothetical protein